MISISNWEKAGDDILGDLVLIEQIGRVCVLRMNRPEKLNALDINMLKELTDALDSMEEDPEIRCIVLTGVGRGFCTGADLSFIREDDLKHFPSAVQFMYPLQAALTRLARYKKPVLAAVNGACVGAGFSLALACDYMIAASSAKFSQIFGQLGLAPDLGSMYFLPRIVGLPKAKELIYTAEFIDAEEAHRLGIAVRVVPDEELLPAALERANKIAAMAPIAVELTKQTLNETYDVTLDGLLSKEALIQGGLLLTEDFKEGLQSVLSKRKPDFKGK